MAAATLATLAASTGVLAPAASADPKPGEPKPAAAPVNRAGELVIGSGNLPDSLDFEGAVLSGAAAGWNAAWASLNRAAVTPPECKVLYAGLPIPKGTDTAQTNGSTRGVEWSMVISKFAMDLAPLRAALPKCGTFKAVRDGATSELSVRPIAVTGAPDGLGLEFTAKIKRGNQVQYLQSRQYTAVVNGVTMSLRGGRDSREPAPFIGADDQLAVDLLGVQIAILKNPPEPTTPPVKPAPSAKPGAPSAKPGAPSAKPAAPSAKPAPAKPAAPAAKPAPASAPAPQPAR
ncbi:hypothetical protein TPB0596_13720 [Tsukamurella pulmonis]|uniref:PknH-like extracellular domain-containing protein n=1 Tax=Tsukamurella pulmonis TaxID=47312 RepID=A0A1H1GSE6_9ACTN|nr:hypothetical protein AXK56_13065 [Tsukamurella pulmonis]BDD81609.1 hypothetical protein TPB0596_13720 [Tsukamurella pulmonis]SDR16115.1 hypothetical protein SAMN04489765_3537 [Tsukamurella pulmonis]SUP16731.1 Uncharacterised protein [Tsukamurella pulmonis]